MKYKHKKLLKILPIVVPYILLAQTTTLEEIQVTEKIVTKTNLIDIDLSKLEQEQINSLPELFKNNSSVEVGGGAINVQRIYLRGIESSNLNISLDGAKQGKNMFQHRSNELGINSDLLKSVDVKTAPDASIGGDLGGSIIMTTKDAQDFVKNNKNYGAIFKTGYNTNADLKHGSATAYQIFNKNIGAYINISGVNSDNYEDGNNNEEIATAYHDRDYLFKISMLNLQNHDLRLTINKNENSGNSRWRGTEYRPLESELEKIVSSTTNYTLQHNYNPNDLINLDTNLNLTDISLDREDVDKEYENRTIGLKIQNHFDFDISTTSNRVSVGTEFQKEHGKGSFDPNALDKNITKYSDADSKNQALFIQNKTTINDLNIYYGLRFDDYEFDTGLGKATDTTFSPNFGLDYSLTENSLIYTNYGKSSRMTGLVPFTWLTNIKKDSTYSNDLEAEKSTKYELGYKYIKNNTFADNDVIIFDANIFKTTIEDLIVSKDINCKNGICGSGEGGRTLQDIYNRSDDFKSKGFELKISYNYDIFSTSLAYTQIDTNNTNSDTNGVSDINEDQNIRRVGGYDSKKFVWNTEVELTNTLSADYTLNAVSGTDVLDSKNNEIRRNGYTTHDISMKYKPSTNSPWTLYTAVNNLTDKQYAKATTISTKNQADIYRYEMGRDFRFSVKYEF